MQTFYFYPDSRFGHLAAEADWSSRSSSSSSSIVSRKKKKRSENFLILRNVVLLAEVGSRFVRPDQVRRQLQTENLDLGRLRKVFSGSKTVWSVSPGKPKVGTQRCLLSADEGGADLFIKAREWFGIRTGVFETSDPDTTDELEAQRRSQPGPSQLDRQHQNEPLPEFRPNRWTPGNEPPRRHKVAQFLRLFAEFRNRLALPSILSLVPRKLK